MALNESIAFLDFSSEWVLQSFIPSALGRKRSTLCRSPTWDRAQIPFEDIMTEELVIELGIDSIPVSRGHVALTPFSQAILLIKGTVL